MNKLIITFLMTSMCLMSCAQDIKLPEPEKKGGKPLMEALNERQTTREFSDKKLDDQTLSNLLWAAYGFNRENMRTGALTRAASPLTPRFPTARSFPFSASSGSSSRNPATQA